MIVLFLCSFSLVIICLWVYFFEDSISVLEELFLLFRTAILLIVFSITLISISVQ